MIRLFNAGLFRLKRDKAYIIIGIVTAIYLPIFMGKEYSDGSIRNKITVGFSRKDIYLSNLIICVLAEIIVVLIAYFVGTVLGIFLFGYVEMEISTLIIVGIIGLFLSLSYVSIFYTVTMSFSNKTYSAIISLILSFIIMFASMYIFKKLAEPEFIKIMGANGEEMIKNSQYLLGTKRKVYETTLYLLPYGQVLKMFNSSSVEYGKLLFHSIVVMISTNLIGISIFSKKQIK